MLYCPHETRLASDFNRGKRRCGRPRRNRVFSRALHSPDCWILFRGEPCLHGLNGIWYLLWAAIAALFSAITVFIWPPGLHRQVYAPRHRAEWLAKITEAGVRRRAELYYQQLDALRPLHQQARKELLAEGRKHSATKWLRQIPGIGPLRAAQLVALPQTPHRFRSKRQLWTYSGLALETHDSAQYRYAQGQLQRSKKPQQLRGLNANHNHDLKNIFKGAAMRASTCHGRSANTSTWPKTGATNDGCNWRGRLLLSL